MFGGWRQKSRGPIGVDLGAYSVKMIQLEQTASGWAVAAAATGEVPPGTPPAGPQRVESLAPILRTMLGSADFAGATAVSCLPAAAVQYKNLRMPKMPPDELAGAIQWEAADRLKLSAEQIQVQYFDAGEVRQGEESRQEIILLAVERPTVEDHLNLLLRCGLKPAAIDVVPGALARAFAFADADPAPAQGDPQASGAAEPMATAVLDVGYSSSKVLICQSGRVVFFKLIDAGGRKLDRAVAEALKLPIGEAADLRRRSVMVAPAAPGADASPKAAAIDGAPSQAAKPESNHSQGEPTPPRTNMGPVAEEALRATAADLAKELGLCLRYFSVTFRGRRPDRVALVGGEARDPWLARALSEGAGLDVHAGSPLAGFGLERVPELARPGMNQGEWAVALGLALRQTDRKSMRGAA